MPVEVHNREAAHGDTLSVPLSARQFDIQETRNFHRLVKIRLKADF